MKKIFSIALLSILMCGIVGLMWAINTFAWSEILDWEESKIYSSYNEISGMFDLKYSLYLDKKPEWNFSVYMTIWDKECMSTLEYKSFLLQWTCTISVNKEEVLWLSKLKFTIKNWEEVIYSGLEEIIIGEYDIKLFWKKLEYNFEHNSEKWELKLHGFISSELWELYEWYKISFWDNVDKKFVNYWWGWFYYKLEDPYFKEKYSRVLKYDDQEKKLYFNLELNKIWTLPDYLNYKYRIYDKNKEDIAAWVITFSNDVEEEVDLNWKRLNVLNFYDEKNKKFYMRFFLKEIGEEPTSWYTITAGYFWTNDFIYDDKRKIFYSDAAIDQRSASSVKHYIFEYNIRKDWSNDPIKWRKYVQIDYGKLDFYNDKTSTWRKEWSKEVIIKKEELDSSKDKSMINKKITKSESKISKAAKKYILKVETKLQDKEKVDKEIRKIVTLLKKYKIKKPKYSKIIDELVIEFEMYLKK